MGRYVIIDDVEIDLHKVLRHAGISSVKEYYAGSETDIFKRYISPITVFKSDDEKKKHICEILGLNEFHKWEVDKVIEEIKMLFQ